MFDSAVSLGIREAEANAIQDVLLLEEAESFAERREDIEVLLREMQTCFAGFRRCERPLKQDEESRKNGGGIGELFQEELCQELPVAGVDSCEGQVLAPAFQSSGRRTARGGCSKRFQGRRRCQHDIVV